MINKARTNGSTEIRIAPPGPETGEFGDLGWDSLSPATIEKLKGAIDPALVTRKGGVQCIEGSVAIAEANRIFGLGGWGFEIAGSIDLREIRTTDRTTGKPRLIRAYSAPVRVTVPGVPPRTDVGFCHVTAETAAGHEAALKGAVTDGLTRALRSFGDRFGNSLTTEPAAITETDVPSAASPQLRTALIQLCALRGFGEQQVRSAVKAQTGRDLGEAAADDLAPLIASAAERLSQGLGSAGVSPHDPAEAAATDAMP